MNAHNIKQDPIDIEESSEEAADAATFQMVSADRAFVHQSMFGEPLPIYVVLLLEQALYIGTHTCSHAKEDSKAKQSKAKSKAKAKASRVIKPTSSKKKKEAREEQQAEDPQEKEGPEEEGTLIFAGRYVPAGTAARWRFLYAKEAYDV